MEKHLFNHSFMSAPGIWSVLCLLVVMRSTTVHAGIEPTGKDIGALRFDALIELNRYPSPQSRRHGDMHALVFARYWVAADYYSIRVIWSEPDSSDSALHLPPAPMTVLSDQTRFSLHHDGYDMYNHSYEKPLGLRGAFQDMFGGYAIDNMRFSEQQAESQRIYTADLESLQGTDSGCTRDLDLLIPIDNHTSSRKANQVQVKTEQGRIASLQLFDANNQLLKKISYTYAHKQGKDRLSRQYVELPERPITVGYQGEGMKLTLEGTVYHFREFDVPYHLHGRQCTVDYAPIRLGQREVVLPVHVTVRSAKDDRVLRSVRFSNYKEVELDAAQANRAAREFSVLSRQEQRHRELCSRYKRFDDVHVDETDATDIKALQVCFQTAVDAAHTGVGEKLKYLNMLMELDRMLTDDEALERHYRHYLSVLRENELNDIILLGGFGVVESTMARGQSGLARRLLALWIDTVLAVHDTDSILAFAQQQIKKNRLWTTAALLEKLSDQNEFSDAVCFEIQRLCCAGLDELYKLMSAAKPEEKGLAAKIQADWVVCSTDREGLEKKLRQSIVAARRSFTKLPEPTESQRAAKGRLDQMERSLAPGPITQVHDQGVEDHALSSGGIGSDPPGS